MNLFSQLTKARSLGKLPIWNTRQSERCFHTSQTALKQVLTRTLRIKHEEYYKRMDGVPKDYEMIYKLPLHYTLNVGKMVAVTTTSVIPCTWLYNRIFEYSSDSVTKFVNTFAAGQDDIWLFFGAMVLTNLIIYRYCNISTLRIYRKDTSYVAAKAGIIPRCNNLVRFEKGEVKEHFKALSIFKDLMYKINGKTMLLVPERFRKPTDLFDMLHKSDSRKYRQMKS